MNSRIGVPILIVMVVCLVGIGCSEGGSPPFWGMESDGRGPLDIDVDDGLDAVDSHNPDVDSDITAPEVDVDGGRVPGDLPDEFPASQLYLERASSCAVRRDGRFRCWGGGGVEIQHPKPSKGARFRTVVVESVTAVFCALRPDDSMRCWNDGPDTIETPSGQFSEIGTGSKYFCALRPDRSLTCWGRGSEPGRDPEAGRFEQAIPPKGNYKGLAVGDKFACALRPSGEIDCWGENRYGQREPPEGRFEVVTLGVTHGCGLRPDDTVDCWGNDRSGMASPPDGRFKQLAATTYHTCGLRPSGAIECWGGGPCELNATPEGRYEEVEAGGNHACAIEGDTGRVECWGCDWFRQATPPSQRPADR